MAWYSLLLYLLAALGVAILAWTAIRHLRGRDLYLDALVRLLAMYGVTRGYPYYRDEVDAVIHQTMHEMEEDIYGA